MKIKVLHKRNPNYELWRKASKLCKGWKKEQAEAMLQKWSNTGLFDDGSTNSKMDIILESQEKWLKKDT